MASGLAVVSTPCGGTSEAIVDGESGLLFRPGDVWDLAEKIEKLLLNPQLRQQVAQSGQNAARERFSESRMLDQIESYFFEITNSSDHQA
jgi:colanic acid/amylovoran biosynthesis glycosyltransferase